MNHTIPLSVRPGRTESGIVYSKRAKPCGVVICSLKQRSESRLHVFRPIPARRELSQGLRDICASISAEPQRPMCRVAGGSALYVLPYQQRIIIGEGC